MIIRRIFGGALQALYKGPTKDMSNIWICDGCQYEGEDDTTCKDCHCELMCSFAKPPEITLVVYEWAIYGHSTNVLGLLRNMGAWPKTVVPDGAYLRLFGVCRDSDALMGLITSHDATVPQIDKRNVCKVGAKILYDDGERYWA